MLGNHIVGPVEHRWALRHVEDPGGDLHAVALALLHGSRQGGFVDVGNCNMRASSTQLDRERPTDAGSCACDGGNLAGEVLHVFNSLCSDSGVVMTLPGIRPGTH